MIITTQARAYQRKVKAEREEDFTIEHDIIHFTSKRYKDITKVQCCSYKDYRAYVFNELLTPIPSRIRRWFDIDEMLIDAYEGGEVILVHRDKTTGELTFLTDMPHRTYGEMTDQFHNNTMAFYIVAYEY